MHLYVAVEPYCIQIYESKKSIYPITNHLELKLCWHGYCFHFSFDAEVDITGSDITTVGDSSFIVKNGEVSILESDHDSNSDSDSSDDSSDASL